MRHLLSVVCISLVFVSSVFGQEIPRSLYVLNNLARSISKMDLGTDQIMNNIATVGDVPNRIYVHNDLIYVVNSTPPGISVINPVTDQVIQNINLPEGSNPYDMAFTGSTLAFVTNLAANAISVIDLTSGSEIDTINVGSGPQGILVVNNTAYVANTGGYPDYANPAVSVIDIATHAVTKTLPMPANAQDLALGPDGNVYVVCTGNYINQFGKIIKINPFGDIDYSPLAIDTIDIGGSPGDIAISTEGMAYLADWGNGTNGYLYRYNIYADSIFNNSANPLLVGNGAMQLLFDAATNQLFVCNFADDTIQKLDALTGQVLSTYNFGDGAQHMAILEPISASDPWPDAVVEFTPGDEAGFGQNYFPQNILGPPDPDPLINAYTPSSKPQEILSLGKDGRIILEFTDNYIYDGDGADFTVFENAFYFFSTTDPFIEAAFVAVSQDGETWYEFPADTATFTGFAGVTPTFSTLNYMDPELSGGDQFDLADAGLDYARYVRFTDLGSVKKEGLYNGDFDLDAVIAVNSKPGTPNSVAPSDGTVPQAYQLDQNYPNPFNPSTIIRFILAQGNTTMLEIFDINGRTVRTLLHKDLAAGEYRVSWDGRNQQNKAVGSGFYIYRLSSGDVQMSKRMLLVR